MSLPEEEIKQQLSFAYVHAVASRAGYAFDRPQIDHDSIDARVASRGMISGVSIFESPSLGFQLKSTAVDCVREDHVIYDLKVKNFY